MRLRCPCFQNRPLLNESVPALNVTTPKCSRVPIWGPDSGPKIGPHSMSTNSWWTFQENQILVHQADSISNRFPKGCWNCPLANLHKVSLLFWLPGSLILETPSCNFKVPAKSGHGFIDRLIVALKKNKGLDFRRPARKFRKGGPRCTYAILRS